MGIFGKLFGGENVADLFNALPEERKQEVVEVVKNYSTPAPAPVAPIVAETEKGNGDEQPTTVTTVDEKPQTDTKNTDNGKGESKEMADTNAQPIPSVETTPVETQPSPAPVETKPEPTPAPQPEYLSKTDFENYVKKLQEDTVQAVSAYKTELEVTKKELAEMKARYDRFTNPKVEYDVKPEMGVAHTGGRMSYDELSAKLFGGKR